MKFMSACVKSGRPATEQGGTVQDSGFTDVSESACAAPKQDSGTTSQVLPQAVEDSRKAREEFRRYVSALLGTENLAVLCGLGTSLCIPGPADSKGNYKTKFPTMWDLWKAARDHDSKAFASLCSDAGLGEDSGNIEELLSRARMLQALKRDEQRAAFIRAIEDFIWGKCSQQPEESELLLHGQFLTSLARRPTKLARTKVFTTNYDLCLEAAASMKGFVVVDGFSHTHPQRFSGSHFEYDLVRRRQEDGGTPEFLPNVFHLYKLHGSVDWESDGSVVRRAAEPMQRVMIYPRENKYQSSFEQPFFEMMSRFHSTLRKPDLGLLIVGFGFSDDHLVEPIRSAIAANISLRLLVVDPALERMFSTSAQAKPDARKPTAFHKHMKALLDQGDDRIAFLSAGFEELASQLPTLVAQTDEELHQERIKKAARP